MGDRASATTRNSIQPSIGWHPKWAYIGVTWTLDYRTLIQGQVRLAVYRRPCARLPVYFSLSHTRLIDQLLLSYVRLLKASTGMSHPSPSSTFQSLFDVALQDYENQTGTKLADHPLAKQLESCDSVLTVTAFLHERARAFHQFRGEDGKFMRSLKRVVHVLYTLSTNAALGESIGLVVCLKIPQQYHISYKTQQPFPPTKAIFAGFAVLLAVDTLPRLYASIFVSYSYISGRPSKTPQRVMMHSWIYSSLWKDFLADSTFMQNYLPPQSWQRSL